MPGEKFFDADDVPLPIREKAGYQHLKLGFDAYLNAM